MKKLIQVSAALVGVASFSMAFAGKGSGTLAEMQAAADAPVMVGKVAQMSVNQERWINDQAFYAAQAVVERRWDNEYKGPYVNDAHPSSPNPSWEADRLYVCAMQVQNWMRLGKQELKRPLMREELVREIQAGASYCNNNYQLEHALAVDKVNNVLGVRITEPRPWLDDRTPGQKARTVFIGVDESMAFPWHLRTADDTKEFPGGKLYPKPR